METIILNKDHYYCQPHENVHVVIENFEKNICVKIIDSKTHKLVHIVKCEVEF